MTDIPATISALERHARTANAFGDSPEGSAMLAGSYWLHHLGTIAGELARMATRVSAELVAGRPVDHDMLHQLRGMSALVRDLVG